MSIGNSEALFNEIHSNDKAFTDIMRNNFYLILTLFFISCPSQGLGFALPRTITSSTSKTPNNLESNKEVHSVIPRRTSGLNAVGGATTVASIGFPKLSTIVATTLTPTLLGFYKIEYGVGYAYGAATAGTAALALRPLLSSSAPTPFTLWAQLHAAAIIFYGIRLNFFLLYREIFIGRFRKMRDKIEDKRTSERQKQNILSKIASRTPFVLGCAFLYAGLATPALVSAKMSDTAVVISSKKGLSLLYEILVCGTWFGFGLGAIGDFNKSIMKALKGEDHLVTNGVYRFFRHPNYTGEVIGWTSNFLASLVSIFLSSNDCTLKVLKSLALPLMTSVFGVFGILGVLLSATTGLEGRQKEKYGETKEYSEWIKTSWKGFALPKKD